MQQPVHYPGWDFVGLRRMLENVRPMRQAINQTGVAE
jgi:hypothetical protein